MFALTRTLSKKFSRGIDNVFYRPNKSVKKDNQMEEGEKQMTRYKPEGLDALCRMTKFSRKELQIMYRGFKNECPTGVVNEETFKYIYAQFFPQGGCWEFKCAVYLSSAHELSRTSDVNAFRHILHETDCSAYAHYVFNTFDQDHSGTISFEEFVMGLSLLLRGSITEKLQWVFSLYDINGDGVITSDEMANVVTAVYDIMGKYCDPKIDDTTIKEHVDVIFQKMDTDKDGVISFDEFIDGCRKDKTITKSMAVFDTVF